MTLATAARRPILIIDSDVAVRRHLRHLLEERGYEVDAVGNVSEALRKLSGVVEPCLILFDLRLLYEGLKLGRRLDLGGRNLGRVPVVAYTADAELRENLRKGLNLRGPAASLNRLCELAARHCPLPTTSSSEPERSLRDESRRARTPLRKGTTRAGAKYKTSRRRVAAEPRSSRHTTLAGGGR